MTRSSVDSTMRVIPKPLETVPKAWKDFRGVIPIGAADLTQLFPGFDAAACMRLEVPAVPLLGHMQFAELAVLVALVRHLGAASFAQIGTFDGLTVLNLLENCPDLEHVDTVDLPDEQLAQAGASCRLPIDSINASMINTVRVGGRFEFHPRAHIVTQIRKDSAELQPSDFAVSPEVFLIDGAHTYEYCASDSRLAQQVIAEHGVIVWHDYGNVKFLPGVTQALCEIAQQGRLKLYWLHGPDLRTELVFGIQPPNAARSLR